MALLLFSISKRYFIVFDSSKTFSILLGSIAPHKPNILRAFNAQFSFSTFKIFLYNISVIVVILILSNIYFILLTILSSLK